MEDKNPIQVAGRLFQTVETLAQTGTGSLAELSQKLGASQEHDAQGIEFSDLYGLCKAGSGHRKIFSDL